MRLYIEYGASLADPDGLLRGTMRRGRYLAFRTLADGRARPLAALVRQAVLLRSVGGRGGRRRQGRARLDRERATD